MANSKRKFNLRIVLVITLLLAIVLVLTSCVKGLAPSGWSGATISNGTIYAGSKEGRLVAIDLKSGTLRWSDALKSTGSGSLAIYGTPALDTVPVLGNLVYIAGYNGKVFAYDAASLQQRWAFPVDSNLKPIVSAVITAGANVYFGDTDGNVYALDAATGGLIWKFSSGGEIWGSPLVDANTVFIGSFDKKVYAIDATSGLEKWKFSMQANTVSTPIALNGVVYIGSLDRNLYAINEANGQLMWKYTGGSWFWAKPVAVNGIIYAPCLDNKIYALEASTGHLEATYDVQGQVASWPVAVNDAVIVATENGNLWRLDTTNPAASPRIIASIPLGVTAPLAINGDVVYVNGPDDYLYAINSVTGEKFPPVSLKYS